MVPPGVKPPYQCSGIVSHQTRPFNVFENVQSQISPFPSRQYVRSFITNENGGERRGTQNKEMIVISKEIWKFALFKEIMLTAEYLPSRYSRNFQDSSEWLLSPRVFQEICVKWGFPELDLFASRACHRIPSCLSWKADPHNLATDAFQQSWKHWGLLYAFPPFSMIEKVLLKVKTEEGDVIPSWLAQPWYSQVLELSVTEPLLPPQLSDILVNPQGQVHLA